MAKTTYMEMKNVRNTDYETTLDFIPTPPWATRAFLSTADLDLRGLTVLEPCVGRGDLAQVLVDAGATVEASDIRDYGWPDTEVVDYLQRPARPVDWVITNPPFTLAEEFLHKAYAEARRGVVLHIRTAWLNGVGRWERVFSRGMLSEVLVHTKNVSATQGRTIRTGSNQINHSWFVFDKSRVRPDASGGRTVAARLSLIPADAQRTHEREGDYR